MPTHTDVRREAAHAFFTLLQRELSADEVLADKQCVRLFLDKAAAAHAAASRKRFNPEDAFRQRLLYPRIDEALAAWCRKRAIRTEPFNVFRYGGTERGPTQHETAIGPSLPNVARAFERLAAALPQLPDGSAGVTRSPHTALAPAFRLQQPLPFGAAGEVSYGGDRAALARGIYQTAMDAATGGDPSRRWRYDCGLFIFYAAERPRGVLGPELFEAWDDVQARVWDAARVWVIAL